MNHVHVYMVLAFLYISPLIGMMVYSLTEGSLLQTLLPSPLLFFLMFLGSVLFVVANRSS